MTGNQCDKIPLNFVSINFFGPSHTDWKYETDPQAHAVPPYLHSPLLRGDLTHGSSHDPLRGGHVAPGEVEERQGEGVQPPKRLARGREVVVVV